MSEQLLTVFELTPPMTAYERREHWAAVLRTSIASVIVSELVTFILIQVLLGELIIEGQIVALVCAGPITAWLADRHLRMRRLIAIQRDQLSAVNGEVTARNAELDAFARAVAHDLKNPLTAVIGLAQFLESDSSIMAADEEKVIPTILEAGERAVEIIEALLLFHGIRNEEPLLERVCSSEIVHRALQTLSRPIADRNAKVDCSEEFPDVHGYAPWLVQVLENLIGNAVKYGGSPPVIDISAFLLADEMVRFEVRDHGPGIPIEVRNRIFDELERVDTTGSEGHGLGLAIARRISDRLGGNAGLDNPPDGGALFWFTVPAADPEQVVDRQRDAATDRV